MELPEALLSSPAALLSSLEGILDLSLDILVLGGVFAGVFVYALFSSKKSLVASLFALIFAGILFLAFPYWNLLETQSDALGVWRDISLKAGILAGIFCLVRFAIRHSVRGSYWNEKPRKLADTLSLSLATSGLLLIYGYRFTAVSEFYPLSTEITGFLTDPQAFFWWLVGALAVVYFFSD